MGSPLTMALAEIRVTDIENLAISTFPHPPKHYRHFVDDGFGHFTDRDHANNFLQHINSVTEDLQYTIEHPSSDGSIPFLDVLIHPDRSTSIYRKPTHTNLYTHYCSSSPTSTKFSIISSLTRRAYTLCSSCHLNDELQFLKHTFLTNGFPLNKINQVMDRTMKSLQKTTTKKNKTPTAKTILPYHPTYSKKIKTALQRCDVSTTFSSPPSLMTVLNTNKTPGPKHSTCNTIYRIPCKDCNDFSSDRLAALLSRESKNTRHVTVSTTILIPLAILSLFPLNIVTNWTIPSTGTIRPYSQLLRTGPNLTY